jgi:2-methylcitrate dehydratase PrpD
MKGFRPAFAEAATRRQVQGFPDSPSQSGQIYSFPLFTVRYRRGKDFGLTTKNLTGQLTDFLLETRYEDLPTDCIEMAKRCLLDFLGVSLLGSEEPVGKMIENFLVKMGGAPESTLIGSGNKLPALNVALANGIFGHALDFDDDSSIGAGHLTTCIAPALLALSEKMERGGKDILLAFVLAYEVASILATFLEPGQTRNGWHATSTIGTFASLAGASKMLGLERSNIVRAFGIAATQTSGLRRNFGTMCKPFHAGKAAQRGLESSLLAQMGFTADGNIFEGKWGVLEVFSGESAPIDTVTDHLRKTFFIRRNWFKPYPSCICTHSAIDGAISLSHPFEMGQMKIEKIEVGVAPIAFDTLLYPFPETPYQAKFSMPFCIATALLEGSVTTNHFSSLRINDSKLLDLMKKVTMVADPELAENGYRGNYGAILRIKTEKGETLTEKVQAPRGHPQNPLSIEDLIQKYKECAKSILSNEQMESSIEKVMNMEKIGNVKLLMRSIKKN